MTYRWVRAVVGRAALAGLATWAMACGGGTSGPVATGKQVALAKATTVAPAPCVCTPASVGTEASPPACGCITGDVPVGAKLAPPQGHTARIGCLAFSPDGRLLLSGSDDGTLLVWELASRRVVQRLEGHKGFVKACAFVSERRVVSGAVGGEVFRWDLMGMPEKRRIGDLPEDDAAYALAIDSKKEEVLVGTVLGDVRAFDLATGARTFPKEVNDDYRIPGVIYAVGYLDGSAEKQRFGAGQGGVRVWMGDQTGDQKGDHKIRSVSFDTSMALPLHGGKLLLAGREKPSENEKLRENERLSDTAKLVLWEPLTGAELRDAKWGRHEGWAYGLAANAQQDKVLVADDTGVAQVWSYPSGERRCNLEQANASLRTAAWDPTGEFLAVAGDDGSIYLANARACKDGAEKIEPPPLRLRAKRGRIGAVVALDTEVLLGDASGHVTAFDTRTWRGAWNRYAHDGAVKILALLRDGRWISGGVDRRVTLEGQWLGTLSNLPFALVPAADGLQSLAGAAKDSVLPVVWSVDAAGQVNRWSLAPLPYKGTLNAEVTFALPRAPMNPALSSIALHPKQRTAVVGGTMNKLVQLNLPDGKEKDRWETGSWPASVTALAYDADGKWLAQGGIAMKQYPDGQLLLRNGTTGAVSACFARHGLQVIKLVFIGRQLWVGDANGHLLRYSLPSDEALAELAARVPACTDNHGINTACLCKTPIAPDEGMDIDEGSHLFDFAVTPDKRYLIAGLEDGRAAVHALPNGQLVAHLIPFADGSWATMYPDNHYEASATGDARATLLELPDDPKLPDDQKRRVARLDKGTLEVKVYGLTAMPDARDASAIKANIFSPFGRPKVFLDGEWEIPSVYASENVLESYDVDFTLKEDNGGERHKLEVRAPGVPTVTEDLPSLVSRKKTRALLIGNHTYDGPTSVAAGVDKDIQGMKTLLQDERTFGLKGEGQLTTLLNGEKKEIEAKILAFFGKKKKPDEPLNGETLIFYYAGHGSVHEKHGILLANDYHKNRRENFVSDSFLWGAVKDSPASRVLIILDACRAGSFRLSGEMIESQTPTDLGDGRLIGVLTSTTSDDPALGDENGGIFTQAFIKAVRNRFEKTDDSGVLSLLTARNAATRLHEDTLNPHLYGKLNQMIFAQVEKKNPKVTTKLLDTKAGLMLDGVPKVTGASQRQITIDKAEVQGDTNKKLQISVYFVHKTDYVLIGIYATKDTPLPPYLFAGKGANETTPYEVPLTGLERERDYIVKVTPCRRKPLVLGGKDAKVPAGCQGAETVSFPLPREKLRTN